MEDYESEIKIFYQNVSFGIFDLILLKNEFITSQVNNIIKRFLSLLPDYTDNNVEFFKLSFMGLRYNFILLKKDRYEPELLLSIYYELEKYFEKIKNATTQIEEKLFLKILEINKTFKETYNKAREVREDTIDESERKRKDLKTILKHSSLVHSNLTNRAQDSNILVFISHTSLDKPLARRISNELEKLGLITWLDEKDILPGNSIPEEIAKALENCSHFLLIYSNNSKDKPWVKTELNNIIMKKNSSQLNTPLVIPILLDNLKPPTIISDIKGIVFEKYDEGMRELFKVFGIKPNDVLSFIQVYRFINKFEEMINIIKSCSEADFFLGINEEYFWNLYEGETLINSFSFQPANNEINHFISNSISYSGEDVSPSFDETFYTFERSGLLGLNILYKYNEVVQRIIDFLNTK